MAPIATDAPGTLELMAWRDDATAKTIVCLINRTAAGAAQGQAGVLVQETIPLREITLRVHKSLREQRPSSARRPGPLPVRWDGDHAVLLVDHVDEMAIVVIS